MTLDELLAREAIRDTMAKCATSGDRVKADDYAACFTEDGIIESERRGGALSFRHIGRQAIVDWQNSWKSSDLGPATAPRPSFVRHCLTTSKIDIGGPDEATARTYFCAWTDIGPDHSGYYLDDFRQVGSQWLIARRRVRMDWHAPNSLFVTAAYRDQAS